MKVDSPQGDPLATTQEPPPSGVLDELTKLLGSARVTVSDFLELVSLEARRAALGLVWMVANQLATQRAYGFWLTNLKYLFFGRKLAY